MARPVFSGSTLLRTVITPTDVQENADRPKRQLTTQAIHTLSGPERPAPKKGIVKVHTRGLNQHGDVCLSYTRSSMVYKLDAEEWIDHFPEAKENWPDLGEEDL